MGSIFSGSAARNNDVFLSSLATQNQGAILTGLANAQERGLNLIQEGQGKATGAIDAGELLALAGLRGGFDAARTSYGDASKLYQPYADAGLKAFGAYGNGIGLNGAAGNDAATAAFRASPNYRYDVDESVDAVARKNAALGLAGSGPTMAAISDLAGHAADREYGTYLQRLAGVAQTGFNATGAQAGLTKGVGDLSAQQGVGEANLISGDARAKAGIFDTDAARSANLVSTTAGQQAGSFGAMTGQILGLGQDANKAGQTAAANNFAALMGLVNAGVGLAGGAVGAATGGAAGGGMSGLGSSLMRFLTPTGTGGSMPTMAQGGMGPDVPRSYY